MIIATRNPFTTIRTEGALLPVDLLQRIVAGDSALEGLDPENYHLPGNERIKEAINHSWNRLLGAWASFQTARGRLEPGEAGTTLTRERWLMPLFQELGYGRLQQAKSVNLDGKEYRVSHIWGETPIHLVGCGVKLETRTRGVIGAARSSPHSLLQEYLNRNSTQLWGMLSNGLTLRVLRDNASLTRQAYLEFDLEAMLTGEVYADFVVLWLVCHQSRVESQEGKPESCWLEVWSKAAQEQGTRALDRLRDGVEESITALGGGFLVHPANNELRAKLRSGELTREGYYRQLLRLVYRLIFLFAAEDRELLLDPKASPAAKERYMEYYSATHLRKIAEKSRGGRHPDLYAILRLVAAILGGREPTGTGTGGLGLPVLGSFLFSGEALPDLEMAELENNALLSAIRNLAIILEGHARRAVDYRNLGTRELGSVYEALLELHPQINVDAGTFQLITAAGNERKTTGSYYTAEDLIKVLLDSALDPVILQAIQRAGPSIEAQIAALLALKICDPACGSGHFLIAAARRIARRLAQLRSGDEEPSPEITRTALCEIIRHCVYGVDINPMSVELCKVNLWLESIEPGKPLSFLDAHIQCGNSLVGVAPGLDISVIPDEAFNPAFGDDKATASALKKRNKAERAGQMGLDIYTIEDEEDLQTWMARRAQLLDELPEETAEQVEQKAQNYQDYLASPQYRRHKLEHDLWTAAFFWKTEAQPGAAGILAPTQEMLRRNRAGETLPPELIRRVEDMSERFNYLHWESRFPKVFAGDNPGFDCMLGNPPWERVKLQEEEFFAQRDPDIATATNKAARQKMIDQLPHTNPTLAKDFQDAKHAAESQSKFLRSSGKFPYTGVGDVNTYAVFSELFRKLLSANGRAGIIVPTGIATDDTTKEFFKNLMKTGNLVEFLGMDNEAMIFSSIDHRNRFGLLTMGGSKTKVSAPTFTFSCSRVEWLRDPQRRFTLTEHDLLLLNPNSGVMPVFRTNKDSELTKKIYLSIPVLINDQPLTNRWGVRFSAMFHMASDSGLFKTHDGENLAPLYEAKMFLHFDHRYSTYEGATQANLNEGSLPQPTEQQKSDFNFKTQPRYWLEKKEISSRIQNWEYKWLIAFRDIANNLVYRTATFTILPLVAVGHTAPVIFPMDAPTPQHLACFLANVNSLVFDYITRQKIGGHLTYTILKQLPVLPPGAYSKEQIQYILPRVLELVYTSYDLGSFAKDMGYHGDPFRWNDDRRTLIRAELDAYYAHLYGLSRDELRYILDPQDVYGPEFPGETFRVLKEKEMRLYGDYRTRRLVLEAWDRLEEVAPAAVNMPTVSVADPKPEMLSIESKPVVTQVKEKFTPEPAIEQPTAESQPMLSDFGLYKCGVCGKMVMGFEKESHEKEKHMSQPVEWKKMR